MTNPYLENDDAEEENQGKVLKTLTLISLEMQKSSAEEERKGVGKTKYIQISYQGA